MKRVLACALLGLLVASGVARAGEGGSWSDKVKLSGDFRYRLETISDDSKTNAEGDTYTQVRHRIRARLYLDAAVSHSLSFGFGAATGGADPISTNETLDGGFTNKPLSIDLAYADVHPASLKRLNLILGKMKNPFLTPGKSELIWDGDLTPEGIAARFTATAGAAKAFANAGYLWVNEVLADSDTMLVGVQGGVSTRLGKVDLSAGGGYFTYTEIDEYDLHELFAEMGMKLGNMPVSLFADYVSNSKSDKDNTGIMTGFGIGKKKDPGSWDLKVYYQELQKKAVKGEFCGSDFGGGKTNANGFVLSGGLRIMKDADLGFTYFANKKYISENDNKDEADYGRMQVDFGFKF